MRGKSATYDEVSHIPAGFSYLTTGLIKLNPQHPPLIKEICALPLLFLDLKDSLDRNGLKSLKIGPGFEWAHGKRFLYSRDADRLLFWARVPAVFLSVGLALLVMLWAQRLWGEPAGILALFLYAFDPTITAHAQFVTTDVGLAFFATLFLFVLRNHLESPSGKTLVLCGISLGCALGAKFSAVILVPIAMAAMIMAAWREQREAPEKKEEITTLLRFSSGDHRATGIKAACRAFGLMILLAGIVLWAIYMFPLDPLFYLKGFRAVNQDHGSTYPYYLMGELKPGGWKSYFLIAWVVKTPIPSLLLLAGSVILFVRGRRASRLDEALLIVPALGFFAGYSFFADDLGVRYLIPCFPFIFIFAARVASDLVSAKRSVLATLAVLMGWYLIEFSSIFPDHLSYFNQFAGGYRRGTEWLDDSNVDWGQGLIQLSNYLHKQPGQDYWFCYFGTGEPRYYGISPSVVSKVVPVSPFAGAKLILSAHCVARARAALADKARQGGRNWLAEIAPKAIVGHAYYIYEFPPNPPN